MIQPSEYEEALELLNAICKAKDEVQAYRRVISFSMPKSVQYYDRCVRFIFTNNTGMCKDKISFNTSFDYSFIRGESHRNNAINISLVYSPDNNTLRIGQDIIEDFDFSESNIFQQSLVYSSDIVEDLEFMTFLKNNRFEQKFTLYRDAFSIEGLYRIKENIEEVLCQITPLG